MRATEKRGRGRPPLPVEDRLVMIRSRVRPATSRFISACALQQGRTVSEELRFAAEAWGLMSTIAEAKRHGDDETQWTATDDLRELLRRGLGDEVLSV